MPVWEIREQPARRGANASSSPEGDFWGYAEGTHLYGTPGAAVKSSSSLTGGSGLQFLLNLLCKLEHMDRRTAPKRHAVSLVLEARLDLRVLEPQQIRVDNELLEVLGQKLLLLLRVALETMSGIECLYLLLYLVSIQIPYAPRQFPGPSMARAMLACRPGNPGHQTPSVEISNRGPARVACSVASSRLGTCIPSLATTTWVLAEGNGGTYRFIVAHIYQCIVGVLARLDDHPRQVLKLVFNIGGFEYGAHICRRRKWSYTELIAPDDYLGQ